MPKSTIFLKSAGDQTWLEIPELNCYVGKSSIHGGFSIVVFDY
jgi:hypothetical protein